MKPHKIKLTGMTQKMSDINHMKTWNDCCDQWEAYINSDEFKREMARKLIYGEHVFIDKDKVRFIVRLKLLQLLVNDDIDSTGHRKSGTISESLIANTKSILKVKEDL